MISVIVPVYNSEKYLDKAVESVLSQSYSDWELILVDDGSTDESHRLCDEWADKDERICVVHRQNGGLSAARNSGLDIAKGDFITFLDSDDMLCPDALKDMYSAIDSTGCDIICGNSLKFSTEERLNVKFSDRYILKVYSPQQAVESVLYKDILDNSAWGKLYKRDLWKSLRFTPGIWYEDLDLFYKLFLNSKKIGYINRLTYLYRQHDESFLRNNVLKRLDVLDVTQRLSDFMSTQSRELMRSAASRQFSANFNVIRSLFFMKTNKADNIQVDEISKKCWDKIYRLRKDVLINRRSPVKNRLWSALTFVGLKYVFYGVLKLRRSIG